MKKNFIIFGVISLFAVSLVFAGITSYILKEGQTLGKSKIDAVLKDKVVIGNKVYSKGDIFREGKKTYKIKEIKPKSWFLGSDKVEVEEVDSSEVHEQPPLNRSFKFNRSFGVNESNNSWMNVSSLEESCYLNGLVYDCDDIFYGSKTGTCLLSSCAKEKKDFSLVDNKTYALNKNGLREIKTFDSKVGNNHSLTPDQLVRIHCRNYPMWGYCCEFTYSNPDGSRYSDVVCVSS